MKEEVFVKKIKKIEKFLIKEGIKAACIVYDFGEGVEGSLDLCKGLGGKLQLIHALEEIKEYINQIRKMNCIETIRRNNRKMVGNIKKKNQDVGIG